MILEGVAIVDHWVSRQNRANEASASVHNDLDTFNHMALVWCQMTQGMLDSLAALSNGTVFKMDHSQAQVEERLKTIVAHMQMHGL